ncbi:hypothetical protein AAZX31_02G215000 [Glycine max]|uniref:Glutaredoxin domain-containing protein n=2 Tax=Glycine subgen. Soja TaxID=1462606 RepID=I1JHG0_SOYBN|nr:uncharacterized protein At5g39865 [Glycine max]XP_028214773.1 uncharacterized protein At5g39865-like [Glycine soja]KAG5064131.1 hypothetical protein JHK85_005314 [Glycine max]KAH1061681.1 hypothetical protein GYH30_004926 [Glycine max]KAH1262990.1 Uncharacterized protein GmHk_02G005485 [Glycine max]KRH72724.1 hypothetical protein GLYMA_02G229600v4 [Glycine max]RZC26316.1 hypothetical protein D0Y65_004807 [Glycine soja]|eukprot:XP_003518317.1 uncharacterized protein At5g39865 [Glycine max]
MWRPWGKSTVRIHSASSSPSSTFSCSSFKDIQTLCLDEPPQQNQHHQQLPSPSPTRKPSVFHRVRLANSLLRTWSTHLHPQPQPPKLPEPPESEPDVVVSKPEPQQPAIYYFPGAEQRVVVYYTSLRVVRPTFEACKSVLSILRGFLVQIDERDVSMDSGFTAELNRIMGRPVPGPGPSLPRVFIAGRYVGGAEEVRQLNEVGELKKILMDLPAVDPTTECHVCAGHRFVLCDECNGSRKVYAEKTGFKTCNACNENGLVKCPSCFPSSTSLPKFNNEIQN